MSTGLHPDTAPALPVEIIADIVDEVATDDTWLLNCSMVSRTWRSCALHHLFGFVALYPERINTLAALLHVNASLVTYIRRATLPYTTLISLPPLWNVDSLHLIILRFECSTLDDSVGRISAAFPRVRRIFIVCCDLCPNHDMPMKLLRSLPCLRDLAMESNSHPPCEMVSSRRSPWVCKVDTLRLLNSTPTTLSCFADAWKNGVSTVENLEYQPVPHEVDIDGEYRDSLSAFMRTTTSLRNVKFMTKTMDEMATLLQALDLSAHKHLRKLTLRCGAGDEEPPRSLVSLVRAIRYMHADVVGKLSLRSLPTMGPWDLILEALSTLSSADETAAEVILELDQRVFMIQSLATLERVLGAMA